MSTEDTGSGTGSVQEPSPSSKGSDESSLAARRARLRGTLSRQVNSPDPYQSNSNQYSSSNASPQPAEVAPGPQATAPHANNGDYLEDTDNTPSSGGQAVQQQPLTEPALQPQSWQEAFGFAPVQAETSMPASAASPQDQAIEESTDLNKSMQTQPPPQGRDESAPSTISRALAQLDQGSGRVQNRSNGLPAHGVMYEAWNQDQDRQSIEPEDPELEAELAKIAAAIENRGNEPVPIEASAEESHSQAAPPQTQDPVANIVEEAAIEILETTTKPKQALTPAQEEPVEQAVEAIEPQTEQAAKSIAVPSAVERNEEPATLLTMPQTVQPFDTKLQVQTVEVLNNIDQAMGACAMNLSALQKIATEQTEAMKALAETMQHQNFFEIGLNLNSVIESMSAALEPMKAVGELVPAIDQLVEAIESRATVQPLQESVRVSPEQLVLNLTDQLARTLIDPWTFKSAYMAIYPDEQTQDLLHRLVDLLGTQKITGEVFRSAYDAVKAEGPAGQAVQTIVKVVQDEALLAELERLRRDNEALAHMATETSPGSDVRIGEMQSIVEQMQLRLEQRETEFTEVLGAKDREIQEAQELLTSRWEEFNARYDELMETLQKRDELLAEKEAELARKETENQQLRTQMEELRDQTKDMVSEMQKQLSATAKPKEEAPKQSSFFDPAPGAPANQQQLFEPAPSRQLFQPGAQQQEQSQSGQMPAAQQGAGQSQQVQNAPQQQQPQQAQTTQTQAIPRPAATTPFLTGGSYGSGVRAQVFEVIVRQALAGAPWREICAGPMQVNNISPEEVEAEVKRRQALLGKK